MPSTRGEQINPEQAGNQLPYELLEAKRFHGHLGPYLAVGLRMGKLICGKFGDTPFKYRVFTSVGWDPPLSCVIDGLQLATPGTIGNSMIKVDGSGVVAAWVENDKGRYLIRLRDDIRKYIDHETTKTNEEQIAVQLWQDPADRLFEYEEVSR